MTLVRDLLCEAFYFSWVILRVWYLDSSLLFQANEFWYDDMYMKVKLPLPVNSNPGMAFPRQVFNEYNDSLRFAARLISGILDYKVILDT